MFFNSLSFAVFLPIVFALHWSLCRNSKKAQNILLVLSSYYFYSCWDWRFLFLLVFSTFLDYYTGMRIESNQNPNIRKAWFWFSVGTNLGFLIFFKYYNFFIAEFSVFLNGLGLAPNRYLLHIILPVGISFYTFHGLSYVIDIYKKRITAERNFVDYALFVSYFPLLVAGPIERATHLLPQIKIKRGFSFEKAKSGLNQILWGLFKKVVIADTCALIVNPIFDTYEKQDSLSLVLGAVFFAFQIYGDFSGYSDIALGVSKLFGIDLLSNFKYPYFSRDIAEFWRRWHISLSSWFRDYVYIPLGGSKGSKWFQIRNVIIIFLLSGFWHGANFTFIAWGLLNAVYFIPLLLLQKNRVNMSFEKLSLNFESAKIVTKIFLTFALTCFGWIFFRADSLKVAFGYVERIFLFRFDFSVLKEMISFDAILLLLFFIVMEWNHRNEECPINNRFYKLKLILTILLLLLFGQFGVKKDFIYFQF